MPAAQQNRAIALRSMNLVRQTKVDLPKAPLQTQSCRTLSNLGAGESGRARGGQMGGTASQPARYRLKTGPEPMVRTDCLQLRLRGSLVGAIAQRSVSWPARLTLRTYPE